MSLPRAPGCVSHPEPVAVSPGRSVPAELPTGENGIPGKQPWSIPCCVSACVALLGLYHHLLTAPCGASGSPAASSQAELLRGSLLAGWSLTQPSRPRPADSDPQSDRAPGRGLRGEAGGQSGKKGPCRFIQVLLAELWWAPLGWAPLGMGEVLLLQQQREATSVLCSGHEGGFSLLVAPPMDLALHWEVV